MNDDPPVSDEPRRLRPQLSRVGNNINQLARSAKCCDAIQYVNVLDEIEPLIIRLDQLFSPSRKKRSLPLVHRRCEPTVVTRFSSGPLRPKMVMKETWNGTSLQGRVQARGGAFSSELPRVLW